MADQYRGMREANARRHASRRAEIESGAWDCSRCERHLTGDQFSRTYNNKAFPGARRRTCKLCESVAKYGLNGRTWQELLDAQGGTCASCGEISDRWCVDHDHACCPGIGSCGACVRGILCNGCNTAEGLLGTAEKARRLADYMDCFCAAVNGPEAKGNDPLAG